MDEFYPSDDFIEYFKQVEGIKGYNPETKRYYPYIDPAGYPTIGVGRRIPKQELHKYRNGLTSDEIHRLLREDIMRSAGDVQRHMARQGLRFEDLDDQRKEMLIDIDFNTGIRKYPGFLRAVANNDREEMAIRHHRWMTDPKTKKKLPLGRNKKFAERYGLEWVEPELARELEIILDQSNQDRSLKKEER